MRESSYDALLLVSFGGPEDPEDVIPFLENVVRGRNVPRARLEKVAEHYYALGGKSPINDQCRALIAALERELVTRDIELPIYWGNRNWDPYLKDAIAEMKAAGVKRALAFVTSAFSSYSGCRQYLENIEAARERIGEGAPEIDKLRGFYNHPLFIRAIVERIEQSCIDAEFSLSASRLVFSAHSIPQAMAKNCDYESQLAEASRLVAERVGAAQWDLVYQSRSGPPQLPWLEPDVCDHLRALSEQSVSDVVLVPIGFISDHMEVIWDLDREAAEIAEAQGLRLLRVPTVGTHPAFVAMICELIEERLDPQRKRLALGAEPPLTDRCAPGCCEYSKPSRP